MAHNWIIEVLADLKTFAAENGLTKLAGQLEETALVATVEISSQERGVKELANWEVETTGRVHRTSATR
ncbi:MAG: hypothetical protein V3U96_01700 [Paracoccaceae bacterium]